MKKIWFIIVSVIFLGIYVNFDKITERFDSGVMGAEVLPMEEIDSLCEGKEDAFMEPEITLNGGSIAYDSDQNMLLIPQNLLEEEFDGSLDVPEGTLYFMEDEALEDKLGAMWENKVARLFWIRDTRCWMYNVYFTGMPVACISSEEIIPDTEISCGTIQVYDQYHSNAQCQTADCQWHLRGATSRNYEKSSYRLTLTDTRLSFLGMRKDDDWILHSLYDDEGLIHNKLSYSVWRDIAADNHVDHDEGISMEYVELFMDDHYLGVYGLSERIDKKALDLGKKDILYKCCEPENPGEDDFYSELTEEMSPSFEWKYPDDFGMDDWEPLKRWTSMFCFNNPWSYEEGIGILNIENAVDYTLFNLLICGMDNAMKNIYYWADYQGDGSYQFIKIPWDLNMTWGNSWIDDYNCNFNMFQEKNFDAEDGWTSDLYLLYKCNPKEIGKLLADRWQELRESIITKEALYT
ncbi:MAG: CotH kinase family protein, partial [Lachnospiraceae bacterium]|nr:CotH kinase family protein [Lachnospiraceae bacterium]